MAVLWLASVTRGHAATFCITANDEYLMLGTASFNRQLTILKHDSSITRLRILLGGDTALLHKGLGAVVGNSAPLLSQGD